MFKSVRLPNHFFSKKKFSAWRKFGIITLLILIAVFFVQQQAFNTEADAQSKSFKAKGKKFESSLKENSKKMTITVVPTISLPTATPTPVALPTSVPTPVPTQVPAPTQSAGASLPSQIINLTNWKLTLPIGTEGRPTEIKQPSLNSYKIDPWFMVSQSGSGVRFRAPVNGVTTSGSGYPRSELREMTSGGTSNASWSSTSGIHTMFLDQAITAVPQTKKHVVAGQVHDAGDDVIVIRLEYPNLYVNVDGKNVYTLDSNYTLGKRFTVKFVVNNGQTRIYYNGGGSPAYVLDQSYSGAYFKTGAYTQSNCSKESPSSCSDNNFGEVIVYQALVTHQ